jgi:hypothetical protein
VSPYSTTTRATNQLELVRRDFEDEPCSQTEGVVSAVFGKGENSGPNCQVIPLHLVQEYLNFKGSKISYQEETRSHLALTYDHSGAVGTWAPSALPAGQALREPAPLFKKLDESMVEEERAGLEG